MKHAFPFIFIYLLISVSIYAFYSYTVKDKSESLESTKSEINGVAYLKDIYALSISVTIYQGNLTFESNQDIIKRSRDKVIKDIDAINKDINVYPKFKNEVFLQKVNDLKYLTKNNISTFYSFLEDANHENYRIADISKLLFEKDRKFYFLSTLVTHYIPEYLISTLLTHNIIEELVKTKSISNEKRDLFIEHNKLIYLSSEEIKEITNLIIIYNDTKILDDIINRIILKLNILSSTNSSIEKMEKNISNAKEYLKISHSILNLSYILNNRNMFLLELNLELRKDSLQNNITFYKILIFSILLLISILMFYFYKSYINNLSILKKLKIEKIKTQKALEFKSQFLSNMSHEIRTPLNSIVSLINITIRTNLNDKQKFMLQKINSASNILLGVVNDILDISKIESGKLTIDAHSFNLKKCVHDVYDMLLVKAQENGISLNIDFENIKDLNILGDSLRISQVLTNLIHNAIKFTHNGEVNIKIKQIKQDLYLFEVKDTGIGLKENQIRILFEEFSQADMSTSRKYGGTGLGLSISKKLIKMMGGKIWIDSEYSKGSTFSFELTLKEDLTKESLSIDNNINKLDIEKEINNLNNIKILVAEDNKMNQMVLSMLLEETRLDLDFANDGQIAVDKFNNNIYNLILMDIQMPNLNGYEATQIIKNINPNIPIIGLSANAMKEDTSKALAHGMDDYLTKPIDSDKLYETLHKFLC